MASLKNNFKRQVVPFSNDKDGSNSGILSKSIGLFYFRFETQLVIHFTSEQGGFTGV